jgi:hypothetical protein
MCTILAIDLGKFKSVISVLNGPRAKRSCAR